MNSSIFLSLSLLALSGISAAAGTAGPDEQTLGRLFFTPAARAELERQKRLQSLSARSLFSSEPLRVDGVVVRSSGRHTVWINGQPLPENTATAAIAARVSATEPGRVRLTPTGESPVEITVGARLEQNITRHPRPSEESETRTQRR